MVIIKDHGKFNKDKGLRHLINVKRTAVVIVEHLWLSLQTFCK